MTLRALALPTIFLVLFLSVARVFAASPVVKVPGDYSSIQAAINAANPGDTIQIAPGLYNENLVLNKTLRLVGEDKYSTIIDAGGRGPALLITASNVYVSSLTFQNALVINYGYFDGIDIEWSSNYAVITCNIIRNNFHGMWVGISEGNVISNNIVTQNVYGLRFFASNKNTISDNFVSSNNYCGVFLYGMAPYFSTQNLLTGNTISDNGLGLHIDSSGDSNNKFYHNNFINNTVQVDVNGTNFWDGNYWSDYTGKDLNGDGIGDTLLPVYGVDFHPLMTPWSPIRFFSVVWGGVTYPVETFSNNTISFLNFSQLSKEISFNVTGPTGTFGFTNMTIPKQLLDAPGAPPLGSWIILLDGQDVTSTARISGNSTHTFIYLSYPLTMHKIEIIGTAVVPEFATSFALLSLLAGLSAIVFVANMAKRRIRRKLCGV
jgi:parallel beta-helix repeat protein